MHSPLASSQPLDFLWLKHVNYVEIGLHTSCPGIDELSPQERLNNILSRLILSIMFSQPLLDRLNKREHKDYLTALTRAEAFDLVLDYPSEDMLANIRFNMQECSYILQR